MTYLDGSTIHVGDLIWWDEGLRTGYVQEIAESKEEYERLGLSAPHIFVSDAHPFDPATPGPIGYPEASFASEGIGRLTPEERLDLDQATERARSLARIDSAHLISVVTAAIENCLQVGWDVAFIKDRRVAEVVKVPMMR